MAPKAPPRPAKAKSVIFLFMYGGPSHVDTFDYKPQLYPMDGKTIAVKTFGRGGKKDGGRVVGPKWAFRQYGECGKWVSDLFPNLGGCVNDIAFLHSMYAESPIHGSAMLMMNSGRLISGNPCLGTWVTYGLGSENENLPGFVVMLDRTGGPISGAKNWSSGYMPAAYQATVLRSSGTPIHDLASPQGSDRAAPAPAGPAPREERGPPRAPRRQLRAGRADRQLRAGLSDAELGARGRRLLPRIGRDPGALRDRPAPHGRLRPQVPDRARLVERGIRFVQIYSGGSHNDNNWDAHADLVANHSKHAGDTDRPIAGLIMDLKRRGLLDQTLIVWGGEFGRQPTAEYAKGTGRDHNSFGFTMWMAGGGIRGGTSVGQTDEIGSAAVEDRFHVKRLHATILHQLGLDPNGLTYFYGGLNQKLVGVEGAEPIHQII